MSDSTDNDDRSDRPAAALKVVAVLSDHHAIDRLAGLVDQWRRDRIAWIALVGNDCVAAKTALDALIRGPNLDRRHYIMTSAHPGESLEQVTDFMLSLVGDYEGDVAIVEV